MHQPLDVHAARGIDICRHTEDKAAEGVHKLGDESSDEIVLVCVSAGLRISNGRVVYLFAKAGVVVNPC